MVRYKINVSVDGDRSRFVNGLLHGEDVPAIEYGGGTRCWYVHGKRHRWNGPAIEWIDGSKSWWLDGAFFEREQYLSRCPMGKYKVTINHKGSMIYSLDGKRHRECGPAYKGVSGYKSWWLNDRCHREDGPAVVWSNGVEEWYLNGERLFDHEYHKVRSSG